MTRDLLTSVALAGVVLLPLALPTAQVPVTSAKRLP